MDLEAQGFNPIHLHGKPSAIASYCANARATGAISCLWICFEDRGRIRAKDINIDAKNTGLCLPDIARYCGWWRRASMYSVVGVEEVEIQFHHTPKDNQVFVFAIPVNHDRTLKDMSKAIEQLRAKLTHPDACGVSSDGRIHGTQEWCPNMIENEHGTQYCPMIELGRLEYLQGEVRNIPVMLKFYWSMRSIPTPISKMRDAGFIHTYESLQTLDQHDAITTYRQPIKAIRLVFGWSWRYIITLVAAGVGMSLCTAVLTALATHDLNCGWSAGSYFAAVVAIGLGLFAALSTIM